LRSVASLAKYEIGDIVPIWDYRNLSNGLPQVIELDDVLTDYENELHHLPEHVTMFLADGSEYNYLDYSVLADKLGYEGHIGDTFTVPNLHPLMGSPVPRHVYVPGSIKGEGMHGIQHIAYEPTSITLTN